MILVAAEKLPPSFMYNEPSESFVAKHMTTANYTKPTIRKLRDDGH